jgi:ABC-2 type transport system ATP-binding protein
MNAIEARHLRKCFGTVTAVSDVSITVREGEIFGFLGPNGVGKTTTTRMLNGIIPPDGGTANPYIIEFPVKNIPWILV